MYNNTIYWWYSYWWNANSYLKYNNFVERIKITSNPSARLLEDHILTQMNSIDGGIADKTEEHIERNHQVGKRLNKDMNV